MTFRKLIHNLAKRIGRHQIPVRDRAVDIRSFLGPDGVHHELITRVVRAIYRGNRCGHLDATVFCDATMEVLAKIRLEIMHSPGTDIDQYRLITEICACTAAFFEEHTRARRRPSKQHRQYMPGTPLPCAEVICLGDRPKRQTLGLIRK